VADGGGGVGLDLEAEGVDPVVLQVHQRGGLLRVALVLVLWWSMVRSGTTERA
jgi:hypothetical protein